MARSLILPDAEEDIRELFVYYLDYSDQTAVGFADAITQVVSRLEEHPYSGTPRPDLKEGIRVAHANTYRTSLFYYVAEAEEPVVTVLRVLRQERDVRQGDL